MAWMALSAFAGGGARPVIQRHNGWAWTFFSDDDDAAHRDLLAAHPHATGVEVWSWVLTPHHVRLILVPSEPGTLGRVLTTVHRHHAGRGHAR